MKFRKKVTSFSVVNMLLISQITCVSRTYSRRPHGKLPRTLVANGVPPVLQTSQMLINLNPMNMYHNPVQSNYPVTSTSTQQDPFCNTLWNRKNLNDFSTVTNKRYSENEPIHSPVLSSPSNFRLNFPEVEYPMTIQEMWEPNFWTTRYDDFSYKKEENNNDQFCSNPNFKDAVKKTKSITNQGKKQQLKTQSIVKAKSYGDATKNLTKLSNNVKDSFQTKKSEKYNDEASIYSNGESNLTLQSEMFDDAYKKLNNEILLLKSIVDKMNINRLEESKEKISTAELCKYLDKSFTNTNCDNLNLYNEFTSPNLVKNRRSQDFEDFSEAMKNYQIPSVPHNDFRSKLIATDDSIDLKADNFNKEMTSIIQSQTDTLLSNNYDFDKKMSVTNDQDWSKIKKFCDCLLDKHEAYPQKINYKEFVKSSSKPKIKCDEINSYADNFNEEMNFKMKTKADDIASYKFECSDDLFSFPQVEYRDPIVHIPIDECELQLTFAEDFLNSYADNFNKKMTYKSSSKADNILQDKFDCPNKINKLTNDDHGLTSLIRESVCENKFIDSKIDTYADEFNDEMTSSINSVADSINNNSDDSNTESSDQEMHKKPGKVCKCINKIDDDNFKKNLRKKTKGKHDSKQVIETDHVKIYKNEDTEEEYTTDSPESNDLQDVQLVTLSTEAPKCDDSKWSETQIVEGEIIYPDEFDQYFILT